MKFRISAGLKSIIGKDLITDDFTAIFELVKNSFDAHATKVEITFKDVESINGSIVVQDNGKGMNYDDLLNKWLFVAYSAKKDGSEDLDYRDKINSKMHYAGAKGIGRFSCDKLGASLRLTSVKDEPNSKIEQITVDWTKFEVNSKEEFVNIDVFHNTLNVSPLRYNTGTLLEIFDLRRESDWNIEKILKLKNSLAKLINPFNDNKSRQFDITIVAEDYIEYDNLQLDENKRINGLVKNNLLQILQGKTIKVFSSVSSDGKFIITEFWNNGVWLYRIKEENKDLLLLHDIVVELYYLNRAAKNNFTRQMGVRAGEYGSIFLYKNGVRVYPFGEPGEDAFELDKRQQKRLGDFVGTSELIGRIEILGDNEQLSETTSRADGLVKNTTYNQLKIYFIDKVIVKLEKFIRHVFKVGIDIEEIKKGVSLQASTLKMIRDISDSSSDSLVEYNSDLLVIVEELQLENGSTKSLLNDIEKVARESNDQDLASKVRKIKNVLDDALVIAEVAEEEIREKEREIKEGAAQNLFLKSLKSQDLVQLVSLMHHIGISSGIISNHLKILAYKLDKEIAISKDDIIKAIRILNLENQKILSISRFATKTNFKMNAENQKLDLVEFITEYIENIAVAYIDGLSVNIVCDTNLKFVTLFRPIEMTIVIDNLINNSRKASATVLSVSIKIDNEELFVSFKDNGIGIPYKLRNKVFDFGFTTTGGSGLGLTHILEIVSKMKGKIDLVSPGDTGAEFLLTFKK